MQVAYGVNAVLETLSWPCFISVGLRSTPEEKKMQLGSPMKSYSDPVKQTTAAQKEENVSLVSLLIGLWLELVKKFLPG